MEPHTCHKGENILWTQFKNSHDLLICSLILVNHGDVVLYFNLNKNE